MSFGGVFMPSDPRERARKAREEFEGMYWWNPTMEGFAEELKKKEQFGAVPVDGREYYEPVHLPEGDYYEPSRESKAETRADVPAVSAYAVQTWSPMIPESYPGMFWDPATGKLSTQKEIMARLRWPKLGDVPYQYNPPRPRGFLGIEYPLVQTSGGAQWGYGAPGYGIPYSYITPDVFGERFGGGRLPPGTRGYTWSNWQGWLAEDAGQYEKSVEEYQRDELKAGVLTILIVGLAVAGVFAVDKFLEEDS